MPSWLAHGSLLILVGGLLAAGFGVPLPEDPILLAAGALAHRGSNLAFASTFASVYVAAIIADCGLYWLARIFGEALFSHRPIKWLATDSRRARARVFLQQHGPQAIFWGRHVAGLRSLLFILAGTERVPFRIFLLFDMLAAMISVPVVFGLGYFFSAHLQRVEEGLARAEHWLLVSAGVLLLAGIVLWRIRGNPIPACFEPGKQIMMTEQGRLSESVVVSACWLWRSMQIFCNPSGLCPTRHHEPPPPEQVPFVVEHRGRQSRGRSSPQGARQAYGGGRISGFSEHGVPLHARRAV